MEIGSGGMISVLIADDHPLMRSGIAAVLSAQAGFSVVAEAGNGDEAVEQYRRFRPDITLMDLQMPGAMASRPLPPFAALPRRLASLS